MFIDWEYWRIGFAASDLAYMIALHWYPDRRARHEMPLLRAYHAALGPQVRYGWDALVSDYRFAHLDNVSVPVYQHKIGLFPAVWWSHLERWFLAFEDLDCEDLL